MLDIRQVTVGHHIIPLRKWHSMVNAIDPTKVKIFGWITVKALPFELWCDLSFGRIGDICGGLQEIDRRTKNMSTICFARIRVKEQRIGSIPHVIFFKNSTGWYLVQLTPEFTPDPKTSIQAEHPNAGGNLAGCRKMNLAHHNRGSPEEVGLKPAAYIIKNQYPGESKGEIDGCLGPHISTEELTPQEARKDLAGWDS